MARDHEKARRFRLYLDRPGLFRPPFTPEQLGMIAAGRMPDGSL
jgi:hypothetical protein